MLSFFSCVWLLAMDYISTRLLCPRDSPCKNTGVGCHLLLQGIVPTQGWNPCLLTLHAIYSIHYQFSSVQSLSRVQLFVTPWIAACQVSLSITNSRSSFKLTSIESLMPSSQPSYPLSSAFPPAPNPSQHQSLFQWVNSMHEVAKVLEFQLQHHSFQRTPRADLL